MSVRHRALSINTFRISSGEFRERAPFLLCRVPWCKNGFFFEEDMQPGKHAMHEAGAYYIQEPSAMAVGQLLMPEEGSRILYLCAAPGGKCLYAAALLFYTLLDPAFGREGMRSPGLLVSPYQGRVIRIENQYPEIGSPVGNGIQYIGVEDFLLDENLISQ